MDRLLVFMEDAGVRATCFVLAWIAERHPRMVRSIAEAGHEVASHGTDHRRVTQLSPADFRESVRRSRGVLEDLLGRAVIGYRAPSFSIVVGREWALDILVEEGYRYDSSLYPIWRPDEYGYAKTNPDPHWLMRAEGPLLEVPPNTLRIFGARLPAGGGAYFRILPTAFARAALQDCQRRGIPGTFYIHPWELDPEQPVFKTSSLTRFRHYSGLANTESKLRKLLRGFTFQPISTTFATLARARQGVAAGSTSLSEHHAALQRDESQPLSFE
jgi:polysaccharide deacetylase family protein (PEP-CTERM system associated)